MVLMWQWPARFSFKGEGTHDQLRTHLADFVAAYNFGRRLKTLRGLTPYEFVCKTWMEQPARFRLDPSHHTPGPNI
jgi:hypothetical protein